ncbi:MAG: glycosyltransferase family 4 protein [Candidatus Aminicenantes bacterium]|nr:MAG: glycosyltransferase family 4 protein [Candidatus Aminicenantes bacterium]
MDDKIKICILTSVHSVFDTRIFRKEATTLVKEGYDVTLIAPHEKNETIKGIKIIGVGKKSNRILRIFKTIKLSFLALKQRAKVYHFHDPELLPVGILLKLFTHKKIIYDVHEHFPNAILNKHWIPRGLRKIVRKAFEILELILVPYVDYVLYTTPIVGERYKQMNVRTERIENLPQPEYFKKCLENDEIGSSEDPYIIYLGITAETRGILEIVMAFSILVDKHPNLKLFLVGPTGTKSYGDKVIELINNLKLNNKVKRIPPVPYEEIQKYLKRASIGILNYLPYPNNMSCLPNKIFEYMACGLPIVASHFPIYKKVVESANYGKVANPEDPQDIARQIDELLMNPELLNEMSKNAVKAFKEKYNWNFESRKLLDVYSFLVQN